MALAIVIILSGCTAESGRQTPAQNSPDQDSNDLTKTGKSKSDSPATTDSAKQVSLFLQRYYENDIKANVLDSGSRRFIFSTYDLNQDGKNETFIGLRGMYFCGSGGCTALLLNSDWELLTKFTVMDFPLTVSTEATGGWKNLIVRSAGKLRELKFNGKSYPSNASVQPAFGGSADGGYKLLETPRDAMQWLRF